ncbi:MAG: hypothetical protein ACFB10_26375 [Salibacteraceae bacterium]
MVIAERRECAIGYFEWDKPGLLKFTAVKSEVTLEDVREYCKLQDEIFESMEGKFVFVFDATVGKWVSGDIRIEWGKRNKITEAKFKDRYVRAYLIIPSMVMKMILKGINMVSNPTVPQSIYKTIDEGLAAAEKEVASWG